MYIDFYCFSSYKCHSGDFVNWDLCPTVPLCPCVPLSQFLDVVVVFVETDVETEFQSHQMHPK